MRTPRYSSYRDSDVPWLGAVPSHWQIKRLKHLCSVFPSNVDKHSYENENSVLLCNYTDVYYNELITRGLPFMTATASDEQVAKFTLRAGDTIITKDSETADDIAISAYVPRDLEGVICGYHLSVVRPHAAVCGAFIKRVFDSARAKACFEISANGLTRVGLSQYAIDNLVLPAPPYDEQVAIARFLGQETAKIDGLIAEQQRLIELLDEKRRAIIACVITRGLRPDVPRSDSGVEWLGEVPSHWKILTLGRLTQKITNGYVGPTRDILVPNGTPYIQATHIKEGRINFDGEYFVTEEWSKVHAKSILAEGDVLIVQTGAGTGDVGVVSTKEVGFNCHALIILSPDRALCRGDFLCWTLQSSYGRQKLQSIQTGAMHPHLNCGNVKFLEIAVPPLGEQEAIVRCITDSVAALDVLISECRHAEDLLREHRLAIVSAAVTGKIDVRRFESASATPKRVAAA